MIPSADEPERIRALDPSQSFIVQAPAGSGKTELLVQRYLNLLLNVNHPEEIVAITFTRKAASEMRHRIIASLQNANQETIASSNYQIKRLTLAKKVLDKDKQSQWNLLENPNRLRIQTFDAFFARLTKQMPLLSRFGSQPQIAQNPQFLYKKAAQTILESLETEVPWIDALTNLLNHLDNDFAKVQKLFIEMLAKRDQWIPYMAQKSKYRDLKKFLEEGLRETICETLHRAHQNVASDHFNELVILANYAAKQLKNLNSDSLINFCDDFYYQKNYSGDLHSIKNDTIALEKEKNIWLGLATLLLTKEGQWRKQVSIREGFIASNQLSHLEEKNLAKEMKERMKQLLEILSSSSEFQMNLQDVLILPPLSYSDMQWQILTSLLELLPILVAELHLLFQQYEIVDYIEIAQSALLALGDAENPTDLALGLDYQILHLLVDEFQDTSTLQFRFLEQLTSSWQSETGKTLFLVGDPMQSIYRFRKAEVGLFLRAREQGIGPVQLNPITLTVNFRSTSKIIEWVNTLFKPLMPLQADIGHGAVPFVSSQCCETTNNDGEIKVQGIYAEDYQTEAKYIVQIIEKLQKEKPNEKIAILVRARSHLLQIIASLQQAKIAYQAVEIESLAQRSAIIDLVALSRALLHLADRIAWLAILRAPWCGLTLNELQILTSNPSKTIFDQLVTIDLELFSSPAKENLVRFLKVIKQSLAHRQRQPISVWIYGTWLALGGPATLTSDHDKEDVNAYFSLIDNLSAENNLDLNQLQNSLSSFYTPAKSTPHNSVEIMTIHKAKGLEFDTVIIPALDRALPADPHQLLLFLEKPSLSGHTHLILAPIKASDKEKDPIYHYLREEEKKRANYETIRLLYVAITRAKKNLYLIGTLIKDLETEKIPEKPVSNSLLFSLWQNISQEFLANMIMADDEKISSNKEYKKLQRFKRDWQLPDSPSGTTLEFCKKLPSYRENNNFYSWQNNLSRTIGTVIHYILHRIAQDANLLSHYKDSQNRNPSYSILLKHHGIEENDLPYCLEKINQAIQNMLDDPKGQWILKQYVDNQSEIAVSGHVEDTICHFIIDRTFVDENNIRWIIDYKTTEYPANNLEKDIDQEILKHKPQLEQYAKIVNNLDPTREINLGLYFPLLKKWHEWKFACK